MNSAQGSSEPEVNNDETWRKTLDSIFWSQLDQEQGSSQYFVTQQEQGSDCNTSLQQDLPSSEAEAEEQESCYHYHTYEELSAEFRDAHKKQV
jgi:hypothetical protein